VGKLLRGDIEPVADAAKDVEDTPMRKFTRHCVKPLDPRAAQLLKDWQKLGLEPINLWAETAVETNSGNQQ
jgi:hypothetical protein